MSKEKEARREQRKKKSAQRNAKRTFKKLSQKSVVMTALDSAGLEPFRILVAEWVNRVLAQDPSFLKEDGQMPAREDIATLLSLELSPSEQGFSQAHAHLKAWAGTVPSKLAVLNAFSKACPSA